MKKIAEKLGTPALLEQTAEECCELAHACLKMARKLRDENPTPKSIEDIQDNLVEELADVELCIYAILSGTELVERDEFINKHAEKDERWHKRLDVSMDLDD